MRAQRGPRGQFSSLYGTTTLRLPTDFPYPPAGPRYERLVFDANDQLIVPLNEWYHLMKGIGAARTRETYLAVLRPWFGFLAKHGYQWNARPEAVREYTRLFLLEAGCALRSGRVEGWFVQATNRSPMSANGLHLLIAALRSFDTVTVRGGFDPQVQRYQPLYAFDHPMYSKVLVAWRSEHHKWIRNAGAPDHAGIRSESRADSARQPVGFFQVRVQPLEPPVARDSESTRLAILAGVRYMIDHAPTREAVILRIMLESGARVSEVLGLTASGLRRPTTRRSALMWLPSYATKASTRWASRSGARPTPVSSYAGTSHTIGRSSTNTNGPDWNNSATTIPSSSRVADGSLSTPASASSSSGC
jgi:hypothetical protein